jgi:predicted nucleic acid-binding protein
MSAYIDSAVLAKSYFPEENSEQAEALIGQFSPPIFFTHLQELEIRNAARLKLFRKEISAQVLKVGLDQIDEDFANGFLQRPVYDFAAVHHEAERLSKSHVTKIGCRTLDVLHVAQAVELGLVDFVSFDKRQRALAKEAGLKIKPPRL